MEVAQIKVTKFQAKVVRRDPIPAGLVGGTISVSFDDSWNGLQITAVFEGAVTKDVLDVKDVIAIPPEVIAKPGRRFKVGFYGTSLDGKIVIPTMYADMGLTEVAADPSGDTSTNPALPVWAQLDIRTSNLEDEVQAIKENGIPGGGTNVDLTGYATEEWVQKGYQPKGNYLSEVPAGYAKYEDIPKKPSDIGAQPAGDYALVSQIPSVPVKSVNGKTGAVQLSAADVGARPSNWMPTVQDVGALPATYTPPNQTAQQVGADPKGTAAAAVAGHNTSTDAHGDIRQELQALTARLNAFFDSDDQTLDELSEIVAYITSNKGLIDAITTSKVSVIDIVNNLTTNVANKPLSAAQGVVLKGLIDTLTSNLSNYALKSAIPTKVSQLQNDSKYLTQHQDISHLLPRMELPTAINTALAQAKDSGKFDGEDGQRGTGILNTTTGIAAYTTAVGGVSPKYRILLSTLKTQSKVNEVLVGDTVRYSTFLYPVIYVDDEYAYMTTRVTIQGTAGTSVTVKSVSESTEPGGSNVVTFSDNKTLTVKNGYTPIPGVDYNTPADQEAIVQQVIAKLPVYNGEVV